MLAGLLHTEDRPPSLCMRHGIPKKQLTYKDRAMYSGGVRNPGSKVSHKQSGLGKVKLPPLCLLNTRADIAFSKSVYRDQTSREDEGPGLVLAILQL